MNAEPKTETSYSTRVSSSRTPAAKSELLTCDICGTNMTPGTMNYLRYCDSCGLWRSTLKAGSASPEAGELVEGRTDGFEALRSRNFRIILDKVAAVRGLEGLSILEIGCAQGWFLAEAVARGASATGIESEPCVARLALDAGLKVIVGVFPEDVQAGLYDAIFFNDVFEHLPEPRSMMQRCAEHLRPNGLLVLNLPSSDGFIFRVATRLRLRGIVGRLWQTDFYTPHLYYFNRRNLQRLAAQHAFFPVGFSGLNTIDAKGLWERISLGGGSTLACLATYFVSRISAPLLNRVLPPDTIVEIFEYRPSARS